MAQALTLHVPVNRETSRRTSGGLVSSLLKPITKIVRQTERIPDDAYAAASFVSHRLDWMNPFHEFDAMAEDFGEEYHHEAPDHIYPHL